jgi:hypothetical protein
MMLCDMQEWQMIISRDELKKLQSALAAANERITELETENKVILLDLSEAHDRERVLREKLVHWVSIWLKDFTEWIEEDEIRIEFFKQDCPELLDRLRAALQKDDKNEAWNFDPR